MLLSESKFLQAEAVQEVLTTGVAQALFNDGIQASFTYLGLRLELTRYRSKLSQDLDGLPRPIKFKQF
jgi:hypothetical protein